MQAERGARVACDSFAMLLPPRQPTQRWFNKAGIRRGLTSEARCIAHKGDRWHVKSWPTLDCMRSAYNTSCGVLRLLGSPEPSD